MHGQFKSMAAKDTRVGKNIFRKLALREVYGSLRYQDRANPAKLFKTYPLGCCVYLRDILDDDGEIKEGHVILGFTKDGGYLLSYRLVFDTEMDFPCFHYSLHWWEFDFRKKLRKVHSIPLFEQQQPVTNDLHILVSESLDEEQVIVWGISIDSEGQSKTSYISICAAPSRKPCTSCQASQKSCFKHCFAVSFSFEVVPPYPEISPCLSLTLPGVVLINVSDNMLALEVVPCVSSLQAQDTVEAFHKCCTEEVQSQEKKCEEKPLDPINLCEVLSKEVACEGSQVSSDSADEISHGMVPTEFNALFDHPPHSEHNDLVISPAVTLSNLPTEGSSSDNDIGTIKEKENLKWCSTGVHIGPTREAYFSNRNGHTVQLQDDHQSIVSGVESHTKPDGSDGGVRHQIQSDANTKSLQGYSHSRTCNFGFGNCIKNNDSGCCSCKEVPMHNNTFPRTSQDSNIEGDASRCVAEDGDSVSSASCENHLSSSKDWTEKSTVVPEKRNGAKESSFSTSQSKSPSQSTGQMETETCLVGTGYNEGDYQNLKVLEKASHSQWRDTQKEPSSSNKTLFDPSLSPSHNSEFEENNNQTVKSGKRSPSSSSCSSLLDKESYSSVGETNSNLITNYLYRTYRTTHENVYENDSEDDIQGELSMRVISSGGEMKCVGRTKTSAFPSDSFPSLLVCQASLDIEQTISTLVQTNEDLRHLYKSLQDYDVQIVDVLPETSEVVLVVKILMYAKSSRSSYYKGLPVSPSPLLQQTGFLFTWNIRNGTIRTLQTLDTTHHPEGTGFSQADSAALKASELRKAVSLPRGFLWLVRVQSNHTVFTGKSLKYVKHPFLPVLLIM